MDEDERYKWDFHDGYQDGLLFLDGTPNARDDDQYYNSEGYQHGFDAARDESKS